MVNDFVGPSRFQWTERQKALANTLMTLLPPELAWICSRLTAR